MLPVGANPVAWCPVSAGMNACFSNAASQTMLGVMTDEQLVSRAFAAHARACAREGVIYQQPSASTSGIEEIGGKRYVVLRDAGGEPMRVYRIRYDDVLKGLRRWPAELKD